MFRSDIYKSMIQSRTTLLHWLLPVPLAPPYFNFYFFIQQTKIITSILTLTGASWKISQFTYLFDNKSYYKVLSFFSALLPC